MPRPVVAAAIVDSLEHPTVLLACSRAYPQELRGQFELPGGKIEEGEDAVAALEREIAEELGAHLRVGERVCPDGGLWWPVLGGRVMGVWLAEVAPSSSAPRAGALDRRGPSYCRGRGCALRPVTRRASEGSGRSRLARVSCVGCAERASDKACVASAAWEWCPPPFDDTWGPDVRISACRRLLASPSPPTAS